MLSSQSRPRFVLSSEQLELLLAFEQAGGLAKLAAVMARDPSVVSRQLQRLAETAPVIVKVEGRWQVSPLGREVNAKAGLFISDLGRLVADARVRPEPVRPLLERAALLVINAQQGLLGATSGGRSNGEAEANLERLLKGFRDAKRLVIHVRHVSSHPKSPFFAQAPGVAFLPRLGPAAGEIVVDKSKANAFAATPLAEHLNAHGIETVMVTGFTANECIDATARQASDFGLATFVVGDATASFDLVGPDGQVHPAERVHRLTLANLHQNYAKVLNTAELMPHV